MPGESIPGHFYFIPIPTKQVFPPNFFSLLQRKIAVQILARMVRCAAPEYVHKRKVKPLKKSGSNQIHML